MVRSFSSITVLAIMTAGMANNTMKDCTSMLQQNIGMRLSDIPGARSLNMVAINSAATHIAEISVYVIICAQKSTPLPIEYWGPERGGYANQPASDMVLVSTPAYKTIPPIT